MNIRFLAVSCLLSIACTSLAQQAKTIEFSGQTWQVSAQGAELEEYQGKPCVKINQGRIELPDANFMNGVIEFDIAFSKKRGFHGVQWRAQSSNTYEEFYMRPHQSGNPDASQYTPVYNGISGWQLYYGEGYSAAINYDFDQWMHVKVVVAGKHAEIYVKDMSQPALVVHEQKQETRSGDLGLSALMVPVRYANFKYRKDDNVKLMGEIKTLPDAEPGTIMEWQVSDAFNGETLLGKTELTANDLKGINWHGLKCEKSGLANLARIQGISQTKNAAFAKTSLHADETGTRQLYFGYSDIAIVFLNGQALYLGQNKFQSRDYRYLGTIGYFDSVFLPLKKGDNELIIAVGETFGGWGLQARLENSMVAAK